MFLLLLFFATFYLDCSNDNSVDQIIETEWHRYWDENSERLLLKTWMDKYPDNIDPGFYSSFQQTLAIDDEKCAAGDCAILSSFIKEDVKNYSMQSDDTNCTLENKNEDYSCAYDHVTTFESSANEAIDEDGPTECNADGNYAELWSHLWKEHCAEVYYRLHDEFVMKFAGGNSASSVNETSKQKYLNVGSDEDSKCQRECYASANDLNKLFTGRPVSLLVENTTDNDQPKDGNEGEGTKRGQFMC